MAQTQQNVEPDFVKAGPATEPKMNSTQTPARSLSKPDLPEESHDYLTTWSMPKGGLGLALYKLRLHLSPDFKAKHDAFMAYQDYLQAVERANEQHAQVVFDAQTQHLIDRLRYLDNTGVRAIMAFCNIKSSGKTTDLLQVLSVIAQYTRRTVLALPATQNNATSTLALMAGINPETAITIEELSRRIDELGTYMALSKEVPKTENGVGIVSEDLNNALDVDNQYNLDSFIKLLLQVLPNVDYIGLDLGNDNIRNDSIALAAARFAHVLNFVFLYGKAVPTRSFRNTVQGYNTDLRPVPQDELPDNRDVLASTGVGTPTTEKVAHSIVIANLASLDTEIDYDEHMRPEQKADGISLPMWEGKGFHMPYDPYLDNADASGIVKPAHLDRVTAVTHQQALRIAVANLEEAARIQGIPTHGGPQYIEPPVPEVPHPFPAMLREN